MCDPGGFRHGTAGYLLTEDRIYHRARYSPQECDEIISIQDIEKYAAVTGYWFDDDLPVYFDELEESEYKTNDYTAFILQYENGKQCLLYVKEYYEDVSNVLYAIVFANRISKAERKAVINAGDKAFNGKDYGKAFQYYAKAYDVEIAKGARMIGYMYDHGLGVARNDKLALEWYLKAAENGDVDAQFMCAICYQLGYGETVNMEKSFRWMSQAANNGNAEAMRQCAKMCETGTGTAKDDLQAYMWLEEAAYMGDTEAQYLLGRAYEEGRYSRKDDFEALSWFKKAADKNHTLAMAKCAAIFA